MMRKISQIKEIAREVLKSHNLRLASCPKHIFSKSWTMLTVAANESMISC